jgi:hypothetical protein
VSIVSKACGFNHLTRRRAPASTNNASLEKGQQQNTRCERHRGVICLALMHPPSRNSADAGAHHVADPDARVETLDDAKNKDHVGGGQAD